MSDIEIFEHPSVTKWVVHRMNEAGYPLTIDEVGPNRAIGACRDGKPLIGVVFNCWRGHKQYDNANDVHAIIAHQPGARFRKQEVFPAFFSLAFNEMECGRITAIIAENNKSSVKLVKNLGFRKEGVARRGYDGRMNALVYSILKHECKYLEDA